MALISGTANLCRCVLRNGDPNDIKHVLCLQCPLGIVAARRDANCARYLYLRTRRRRCDWTTVWWTWAGRSPAGGSALIDPIGAPLARQNVQYPVPLEKQMISDSTQQPLIDLLAVNESSFACLDSLRRYEHYVSKVPLVSSSRRCRERASPHIAFRHISLE
jgi:hypothetical protein